MITWVSAGTPLSYRQLLKASGSTGQERGLPRPSWGHAGYHELLEKKTAGFFEIQDAIIYTTGYTANSASLQCLLTKDDLVILDAGVHASVMEGGRMFNRKTVRHNDLDAYEHALKLARGRYPLILVVIDGVYSKDGDLTPLPEIIALCKTYGAKLMVDDAHGTGVIGKTGRGLVEVFNAGNDVDLISCTFSKTFGHIGDYIAASKEMVSYLKYQSRQHLFSASLPPAALSIVKAIELVDEEPHWMNALQDNIRYFHDGLTGLGLDIGQTRSAIFPVRRGIRSVMPVSVMPSSKKAYTPFRSITWRSL